MPLRSPQQERVRTPSSLPSGDARSSALSPVPSSRPPFARFLSTRLIVWWAIAGYAASAVLAVLVLAGSSPAYVANVVQLVMVVPPVAVCAWRGGRRASRSLWAVLPWRVLGAGWTLYLFGLIAWNVTYVAGWNQTEPTVWDVAYLAALPLFAVGLVILPRHPRGVSMLPRLLVDGLLVSVGLLAVAWVLWVGPQLESPDGSAGYLVGAGYIVLDLALLGVALVVLVRAWHSGHRPLLWMTIGFAILALTDLVATASGFGALTFDERWLYVGFTVLGVPLNTGMLLAARDPRHIRLDHDTADTRDLVPPVVAAAGATAGLLAPGDHRLPTWLVVGMLAVAISREYVGFLVRRAQDRHHPVEVSAAREGVRRRLADDIHDEVLQNLIVMRWDLEDLAERGSAPELDAARATLEESLLALRRVIAENHSAVTVVPRLSAELERLVAGMTRGSGPSIHVEVQPGAGGPANLLLVTVTRELVRNAIKHASATTILIRVARVGATSSVTVVDDGCGIPDGRQAEAIRDGHVGLASSVERIEEAGGTLVISPGEPAVGGTVAEVRLPSPPSPPATTATQPSPAAPQSPLAS